MAILWQKNIKGVQYEVRTAGRSRRLYTDGVFHSQYHPARGWAGGVWDLLMLPAFFYPPRQIRRVLVLGVGGGAVIQQLHRFVKPELIIGVELNPVHLQVARRFFGIKKRIAQLVHADALAWLKEYEGPPFDLIVEDLFTERNGEPVRVVQAGGRWLDTLSRNLTREGMLVMNFIAAHDLRNSACCRQARVAKKFKAAFQLSLPVYENAVGAFLKTASTSRILRKHLATTEGLPVNEIDFRIRRLTFCRE